MVVVGLRETRRSARSAERTRTSGVRAIARGFYTLVALGGAMDSRRLTRAPTEPKNLGVMRLWSDSWKDGAPIPARYALGRPSATGPVELADNLSPHIAWAELPPGTRSL